jgi:hypothetical protein
MELDFGGIGKQYAVDRAYDLAVARRSNPFLINFSGDLRANRPPASGGDDFRWIRRALGYGMASATAYVRLRENVHWLSDTVAAAAIEIATAQLTMNRRQTRTLRWELSVEPVARGGTKLAVTIILH